MNKAEILNAFYQQFPQSESKTEPIVVLYPGRVNLIGEHTDYNDGFVLPMAIDAKILLAGSLREDKQVHLYSLDFQEKNVFDLESLSACETQPWSNYIRGVCAMFLESTTLSGMNIALQGNIPQKPVFHLQRLWKSALPFNSQFTWTGYFQSGTG